MVQWDIDTRDLLLTLTRDVSLSRNISRPSVSYEGLEMDIHTGPLANSTAA